MRPITSLRHGSGLALLIAAVAALIPASATAALHPRATFGARGTIARAVLADQAGTDARGRPVAAFSQSFGGVLRVIVTRWTSDGHIDRGFGDGSAGAGSVQLISAVPAEIVSTPRFAGTVDGGLVLAASVSAGDDHRVVVVRLADDGAPAAGFGNAGVAVLDSAPVTADPLPLADGRIVLANEMTVTRLTAAGALDAGFGFGGTADVPGQSSALAVSGDRVFVGMDGALVSTLSAAGQPDGPVRSFGTTSQALTEELRAVGDRIVVRGSFGFNAPGPPNIVVRSGFVGDLADGVAHAIPGGAARIDDQGRVVLVDLAGHVRRFDSGGVRDGALNGSLPKTPGRVLFSRQTVGLTANGIVVGGLVGGAVLPAAGFAALRADGTLDRAFGGPVLLKLRGQRARLDGRIVPVRVHCADGAQRRCVVGASAGSTTVRAFVAPGGDRRLRVPITRKLARAIRRVGRKEVRLRLSVIEEEQRIQEESVSVAVRR
jgi:hypothetical protein